MKDYEKKSLYLKYRDISNYSWIDNFAETASGGF